MDLKKLLVRASSGLIYVAVIVGTILWGYTGLMILGILFGVLATIEFEKLCGNLEKENVAIILLDLAGVLSLVLSFNPLLPFFSLLVWIGIIMIRLIVELYLHRENPLFSMASSFFIQLYIGVPLALMGATAFFTLPKVILLVFIFLWINDTGAYLVGSFIGRHKLFERISPKKSWEGFFGGLAFNLIAATAFCYCSSTFMGLHGSIVQWLVLALVVTVFGTWGDLIESLIKRYLHVKDSGNLIPGHGGILDRIDSFLLAMPAVFLYFVILYLC